jgi:hypothetical protein
VRLPRVLALTLTPLAVAGSAAVLAPPANAATPTAAPAAAPPSANHGGTPHGWCTFIVGSTTVSVMTTRVSYDVAQVDVYAGKPVHVQDSSYFVWPKLHLDPHYGTHYRDYEEGRPSAFHIRATRGGHGDSCTAPVTDRIAGGVVHHAGFGMKPRRAEATIQQVPFSFDRRPQAATAALASVSLNTEITPDARRSQ